MIDKETMRDAERYRWLKSLKTLKLETRPSHWKRPFNGGEFICPYSLGWNNVQAAPYETLDEIIDNAMVMQAEVSQWLPEVK
jgi:hypothetical protein